MFERFTERARQVVVLAQEEARTLKHNYIGTEHILLGLLREEEGLAARVLESLDITVERVRAQVVRIVGSGEEVTSGQIPFTPRAKKVLELALREALSLGHNYIGTEHILLGLVRENEGVAARILLDFDADSEKIRNEVIRILSATRKSSPPQEKLPLSNSAEARAAKEAAIERQDFEKATEYRVLERRFLEAEKEHQAQLGQPAETEQKWYVNVAGSTKKYGGWVSKPTYAHGDGVLVIRSPEANNEEPVIIMPINNIVWLEKS